MHTFRPPVSARHRPLRGSSLLVTLLVAIVVGLLGAMPAGAAVRAFSSPVPPLTIHGDIAAIGNANSTCAPTWNPCTPGALGNHNSNKGYGVLIDIDGVGTTTNSSASGLALPAGAVVRTARLVWGSAGDGTNNNGENAVRFDTPATPGVAYSTVTAPYASQCGNLPPIGGQSVRGFSCAADVTALVSVGGNGVYTVGGIEQRAASGGTTPDHWSGWGLYVVYELPSEPLRRLVLSDGFQRVSDGVPTTIPVTGFVAPASGAVKARLTYMVGEGDSGLTGDNATFGTQELDTATPPDLMDSSITGLQYAGPRTPSNINHYGFDMDSIQIDGAIPNAATSANFAFRSDSVGGATGETYYPFALGVAIELGEPELVLTKTLTDVNGGVVEPGDVIEYNIEAVNSGNDGASGIIVSDPIPANTTYVPGSMQIIDGPNAGNKTDAGGDDQGSFAGNIVTLRLGTGANATVGGTLAAGGATSNVRFRVRINTNVDEGVPLVNTASAVYRGQTSGLSYADPSSVAATPVRRSDMTIAQVPSSGMTNGLPGSVTLTASNIGGSSTYGQPVTVNASVPAGMTFTGITASAGWACTVTLPSLSCTRTDALAGGAAYPAIVYGVTPSQSVTTANFTSSVSGGGEVNLANNTDADLVTLVRSADLQVTKTASAATARIGDTLTYTVGVRNFGPSNTTGVVVTDTLPAGLQPVSATSTQGTCALSAQTYSCAVGALADSAAATITITATVRAAAGGTTLTNTAAATGADPDPLPVNGSATATTTIAQAADLAVTKTVSPANLNPGSAATWTITVTNNGPGPAPATTLVDDLPAGITVQSITTSAGSCGSGDPFTCNLGTLASGASATITVVARPALAAAGTTLTNSATATSSAVDLVPANNTATSPLSVNAAADLRISKTVDRTTANVDELLTWTLTVTNDGPSAATGVTITDTAPSGVTLQSVTPGAGIACTTVGALISCTVPGPLASGATRTVTLTARVNRASAASPVANSATVSSAVFDPDNANNLSTVSTSVAAAADLRVSKTADRATARVGDTISWTVTATNDGPSPATGVQLTDTLPLGVTVLTRSVSQGTCTLVGQQLACAVGGLASGATATLTVTARVDRAAAELPLQNVAQVTGGQFDPDTANNSTNVTTTIGAAADLTLTKTANRASASVGDAIVYTLELRNNGPSTATNATVTDSLPAGLKLVGVPTVSGGTCTGAGQNFSCTVASLPDGATRTITATAIVLGSAAGTTLSNIASVTGDQYDQDPANNTTPPAETNVGGVAALTLSKTVNRAAANVGDTLIYTLTASNAGPQAATSTTITDALPAGLTRLSATASQGGCSAGNSFTCALGSVPVGASAIVTVTARVDLPAAGSTLTNTASAASTQDDLNPADNTASATTTIAAAADLRVVKTADRATANVGDAITWTVTATNDGPQGATGVTIADTVPAGITLSPVTPPAGVTCTTSGQVVSCAVTGTLASGSSRAITLTGIVQRSAADTPLQNSASVAGSQLDPNLANNLSAVTTTVGPAADLRVSKTVDRATANVGDTLTWTISATNDGPSVAPAVQLIDDLPAGTTLLTSTPSQGTCAVSGPQLVCSPGALGVGQTISVTITARVERAAAESPVSNAARVTSGVLDPDPANNLATAVTTVGPSADLRITKTADRANAAVGDTITYTLTATNLGPSAATGVSVSDVLPATLQRLTATSSQGICTPTGQSINCALGGLANNASATITITARVLIAGAGSTIANTAQVAGTEPDPAPANNATPPTSTVIAGASDLALTKSVDRATANVGDAVTYTLSLRNLGPQAAPNTHVIDTLPSGLQPLTSSTTQGTCTTAALSVDCDLGTVAVSPTPVVVTITARVLAPAATTTLTNSATATTPQLDPVATNNTATANTTVAAAADLRITKTADRATANVGDLVTFTLTATNAGPSAATGVTLTDTLPAGFQLVGTPTASAGTCSVTGQQVVCVTGNLASGATATATIVARVTIAGSNSTLSNTATVNGDQYDPTPGNDTSPPTSTVISSTADLVVTQTVDKPTVNLGDIVEYTVSVRNDGPQGATGVALSDDLPAGVTLLAATPSQGTCGTGDPFACALGSLGAGATATVVVRVRIVSGAGATFSNLASATATQTDPTPGNNSATAATTAGLAADLRITKTADRAAADVGETITWTLTATNDGPSPATGVTLTDTVPAGVNLLPITAPAGVSCSTAGQVVSCARAGTLAPGASVVLTLRGTVRTEAAGAPLANSATVGGNEFDPDTANNLSAVSTSINAAADLRISKGVSQATANVGDTLTWTIVATNDGPSAAPSVVITDDLPAGITVLSSAASVGTCTTAGTQLICTPGTLASGASVSVTITARVLTAAAESPVSNTARVTSGVLDPDPADNLSTATTTIGPAADLRLSKAANKATANVGDTITYTLIATNDGPSSATGAAITDTLPAGLLITGTPTSTQGACAVVGQTVTCSVGTLASGASATATIAATVRPSGVSSTIANSASVSGDRLDPQPANNTAGPANTLVGASADLVVTHSVTPATLNLGDTATFTITVRNDGPSPATAVQLSDDLPANTTLLSRTTTQGTCTSTDPLTCNLGTLAPGATATIVVRLRPDSGASATFTASASATATEHDPTPANNAAAASISTGPSANLSLTKTADRPAANVGETITWTLTAANSGPSTASGVLVTDTIPAGISGVTATGGAGVTCTIAAGTLSCAIAGPWASGSPRTISLTGVVDRARAGSPLANQATIAGAEFDPDLANNVSTATTNINTAADLRITKTADRGTANVGDTITWTVAATNDGPSPATATVITDDLPAGVTLLTATATQGTCSPVGAQVVCTVGGLASGQTVSATITARVNVSAAESPVVNAARVTSGVFDPDTANNISSVSTAVGPSVDVSVTAAVDRATANIGDELVYTFTVANAGPSIATSIDLRHLIPAGTTYVSASAGQGGCALAGSQVNCAIGTLASGASTTVTVRVRATAAAAGTTIDARASVDAAEPDRNLPNDTSAIVQTAIGAAADLRVVTTVDRPSAAVGDTLLYTVAVTNDGPSTATGVTLTNGLPAGTTILAVTPSQGTCDSADPRVCQLGTLAPGASATLLVQVRAETAAAGNLVTDAASVTGDQFDPVTTNNNASASSAIGDAADLRVTKTVDRATAETGDTVTWTITASNLGPQTATGVTVADALPAGVTLTSVTTSAGTCASAVPISCALGTLATGQTVTITVVGTIQRGAAGNPLTGQATITGAQLDPNPANNVASATTTVGPAADLRVTKLVSNAAPAIGDSVSWTIQAFNDGPLAAPNTIVTDVVPAGAPVSAVTSSTGTCTRTGQSISCNLGTLASGASATVTVVATVATTAGGAVLDNAASMLSAIRDPDTTNNIATARATVGAAADLSVTLTPDRTSALVGQSLGWTALVANAGPQTATGVVSTITLPSGLTGISASVPGGSCQVVGTTVTCTAPDIASGASTPITMTSTVGRGAAERSLTADALVAGALPDPNTPNNTASAALVVIPAAVDLVVSKTIDKPSATVGEQVTITTTVLNRGPSTATGVVLVDNLPAGVTLDQVTPSQGTCQVVAGQITCELGSLADGATATITVKVTVNAAGAGQQLLNESTVTSPQFDIDGTNNAAEASTGGQAPPDLRPQAGTGGPKLSVTKTVDQAAPQVGSAVVFTITATNTGDAPATGVRVTDALPAGLFYVGTKVTGGVCTRNARTVTCTAAMLASGASVVVRITAKVAEAGQTIRNVATAIASRLPSASTEGQTAGVTVRGVGGAPFIVAGVKPLEDYSRPGRRVRIALKITNVGKGTANNTVACFELPKGVVLLKKPAGLTQKGAKFCLSVAQLKASKNKRVVLSARVVGGAGKTRPKITATSSNARVKTEAYPLVIRGRLATRRATGVTG